MKNQKMKALSGRVPVLLRQQLLRKLEHLMEVGLMAAVQAQLRKVPH